MVRGTLTIAAALVVCCAPAKAPAPAPPKCPDLTPASVEAFDFGGEMKLQPATAAKLKAGVQAVIVLRSYAESVDAELKAACTGYLTDLGVKPDAKASADPCAALSTAINEVRSKIGGVATVSLDVAPPVCSVDLATVADCASQCDPTLTGPTAAASCEPGKATGSCGAQCAGACEMNAGKCAASCTGNCDAKVKGTCSGVCAGRCDGKLQKGGKGNCSGVCDGTCDGNVVAACSGNCTGTCKMTTAGACPGTCTGTCSAEMTAAKCTREIVPPKLGADCKARCDVQICAGMACAPIVVALGVAGAVDQKAAGAFKVATEKNLPPIAKLAVGMASRIAAVTSEVGEMVTGVQATIKTSIPNPEAAAEATACFGKPLADTASVAAKLNASVDVALRVKASVTGG